MSVTYSNYLKLDELLAAQRPLSDGPEHDEMLFIVIHQVYELWFKQLLHETSTWCGASTPTTCRRSRHVQTHPDDPQGPVAQIDILETMTPVSFLSFRARLETASGFQSPQFRELEFRARQAPRGMVSHHAGTAAAAKLEALLAEPSLWDTFVRFLGRRGVAVPASLLERDRTQSNPECPELQPELVRIYHEQPELAQVCERLVDLDEGIQEWRYRHVKMVERTIGTKPGSGGSSGVEYLKRTLFQPLFPDLWAIRAAL